MDYTCFLRNNKPAHYFVEYILTILLTGAFLFLVLLLNIIFRLKVNSTKYPSVEGTRGYLALMVFLHHVCIWFFFLHTGKWDAPPIPLFNHFGQTGVGFFFMITAFLFTGKLMESGTVSWTSFFRNRFLRLFPLYAFSVLLLLMIVLILSGFHLNVSAGRFIDQLLHWFTFTYTGAPDINQVKNTWMINAGVVWSLRYEILFYVAVPFIAVEFGKPAGIWTLVLCFIVMVLFFVTTGHILAPFFLYFGAGFIVALLYRHISQVSFLTGKGFAITCLLLFSFIIYRYSVAGNLVSFAVHVLIFVAIASGNSFFGLLHHPASQLLGQLSYSIYMLHGMVLFVCCNFVARRDLLLTLDLNRFLLFALLPSTVVILISFTTYKLIELPFMKRKHNARVYH